MLLQFDLNVNELILGKDKKVGLKNWIFEALKRNLKPEIAFQYQFSHFS
jgi:hypothetical protein